MKTTDDTRLNALLQKWQDIDAPADFEPLVWQRIRAGSAPGLSTTPAVDVLPEWFLFRAGWVNAVAAVLGIMLGVWVGLLPHVRMHDARPTDEPLLHSRTLTGSYLAMAGGGGR